MPGVLPEAFAALSPDKRKKAVRIANALVKSGVTEAAAVASALMRVRRMRG